MAQVWYDNSTMVVKAVYSGSYNGSAWADRGYVVHKTDGRIPQGVEPGAVIEFDAEGNIAVKTPAPAPAPVPDPQGFVKAARDSLGRRRARELYRAYPDFVEALDVDHWTAARDALADALEDAALTQEEHDALEALMSDYNIPESD